MQITPIAFNCKSCILSTKNVVKQVFANCRIQLSDKRTVVRSSLRKPNIKHSFCTAEYIEAETLTKKKRQLNISSPQTLHKKLEKGKIKHRLITYLFAEDFFALKLEAVRLFLLAGPFSMSSSSSSPRFDQKRIY